MTLLSRFLERAGNLPAAQTRDLLVEHDLRVPMPDGATLLADRYVARPLSAGAAAGAAASAAVGTAAGAAAAVNPPLVLVRSPYGRRSVWGLLAGRMFAERGFQSVVQSCRGTFGSGGALDPFGASEGTDALATVDWLREQRWYPGSFGTYGPSYLGIVQWALAAHEVPDLKAMAIQVACTDVKSMIRPSGSFALETMLGWIDQVAHEERPLGMVRQQLRQRTIRAMQASLPLGGMDLLSAGHRLAYWQHWLADGDGAEAFWREHSFTEVLDRVTVPVCLVGGWHDIFLPRQLSDYCALVARGQRPELTIGPWRHADNEITAAGLRESLAFLGARLGIPGADDRAADDRAADDRAASGRVADERVASGRVASGRVASGRVASGREQPVRIFVTGLEQWRDLPSWPPASTPQTWYLQPDGGLSEDEPPAGQPDTYTYDPADPTPNLAGPIGASGHARVDNRVIEARPDVLTFTSDALADDLEVIGVPSVDLHVGSSTPWTDFFARLCEVSPAGVSLNICDGLVRLTGPAPAQASAAGPAGDVRRAAFELWPVAHRFARGSRLRLQVSSGAHPRFARNLGSGESLDTATTMVRASQRVYHDPEHRSALLLPVCRA